MAKLVMVHGTGAGDVADTGKSWWQLNSQFQADLAKRLDLDSAKVGIVPFHWELGPNSENGRRSGGAALLGLLKGYEQAGEDYYLIGHSHGGSVIHHALLNAVARGQPLDRLKAWCTIGTPFLEYRPNPFLFNRLGNTGLTIYATAVGALLIAFGLALMYIFGATPFWKSVNETLGKHALIGFYVPVIAALTIYGVTSLALLYWTSRMRGGSYSQAVKSKVASLYRDRWIGLWHPDDEAISALSNVKQVHGAIIPSNFLVPLIGLLPLLLTVAACVYAGVYFLWDATPASKGTLDFFKQVRSAIEATPQGPATGSIVATGAGGFKAVAVPALLAALLVAIYIGLTGLVVGAVKIVAGLVGIPLSKMIDGLVWSSVRQQAWGDDRGHESVHQIGTHPAEFAPTFTAMPKVINDKLSENSEKHAVRTLHKVRVVLGMAPRTPSAAPDMRAQLSEQLSWQELIHTTYFDIPEFVDLAACALQNVGLSELRSDHWDGARRTQAQDWLRSIRQVSPAA